MLLFERYYPMAFFQTELKSSYQGVISVVAVYSLFPRQVKLLLKSIINNIFKLSRALCLRSPRITVRRRTVRTDFYFSG